MLSKLRIIPFVLFIFLLSCKDNSSFKSVQEKDKISSSEITFSAYWKHIKSNTDIQEKKILEIRNLKKQHLKSIQNFKTTGKWKGKKNSKFRKKTNIAYNNKLKSVLGDENYQAFQKANTSWKNIK